MLKRMLVTLTVTAVVLAALGFVKVRQIKTAMAAYASFQPPPEAVTTIIARQERWPATITAIGTVAAVRGVTVSADLPGVVERIAFDSGKTVAEGGVLVELDTRQERAQLSAAAAQRDLARANLDRMRNLTAAHVVAQSEMDRAEAEYKRADASVGEIRATIARKTIRAPFSGALGLRQVNLGQYLGAGTPIVALQALTPIYVNFAVPQQRLSVIKPGTHVRAAADDGGRATSGAVTAIDSVVDPDTRNVQIQATFANPDRALRPGMFVQTTVALGHSDAVIELPASSINYAPYGDSVFVVETEKGSGGTPIHRVRQRFVKLGPARGDQVAVVSGIKEGEEIVTSGVFKLRNNVAVQINNSVQPSNSAAPAVEDR